MDPRHKAWDDFIEYRRLRAFDAAIREPSGNQSVTPAYQHKIDAGLL
jgi:hypothetical protein